MSDALRRVTAFVLAGGMGTRLRAAVPGRQKVIAPVGGSPILARVLDQLAAAGIRRAVLGVGHLAGQVRELLGPARGGMELAYREEPVPLGTAGALRHARDLLHGDPVLVLNGDSYVEANLAAFLAWHRARRAAGSLLLASVPDPVRYGTVESDPGGRVVAFREKAPAGEASPAGVPRGTWISAGVYLLARSLVAGLPERTPLSLERDVFPTLVGAGLYGYRGSGRFIDIGTPESYAEAQAFFTPPPSGVGANPPASRPFVLLDRDGTLIRERHYLSDPGGVELLPGVPEGLRALGAAGFALVVATNQAGVGRGLFREEQVRSVHARLAALLEAEGVTLDGMFYCPHHPDAGCECRKPATGLARQAAAALGAGARPIAVIGDKRCDIDLARALGVPGVLVTTGYGASEHASGAEPDFVADSLVDAAAILRSAGAPCLAAPARAS